MSTNDFEVHPRGTSEELSVLRQFVKEIIHEVDNKDCSGEFIDIVAKISLWYVGHNERYPNV
jgi:hypothetical protein